MEFFKIFWKNNVQDAYLPKVSISEQIVSEIHVLAQLCLDDSIQILLNLTWVLTFRHQSHNWANISETIGATMLEFGK